MQDMDSKEMDKGSLHQLFDLNGITAKHLEIFRMNRVEVNKAKIKLLFKARQQKYVEKKQLHDRRLADLVERQKAENTTRMLKNKQRLEHFCFSLCTVRTTEFHKNLDREKKNKKADQRLAFLLANIKLKRQKNRLMRQELILKTLEKAQKKREKTAENPEAVENEEIPITENVSDLEPRDQEHLSFNAVILQRLENVMNNFETSEQGEAFFSKTKPLWNEVTRCLRDPEVVVVAPKSRISTEYGNKFEENYVVTGTSHSTSVLLQQLMGNNENYYISDAALVDLITSVTKMFDRDADLNDIIDMIRVIVEHNADSTAVSMFIANGLNEKTVFEYAKRDIAKTIFVEGRKSVDRLKHINTIITNAMIESRDREMMEMVLRNLLKSDDFVEFDGPLSDEKSYVALISETASDRMMPLLETKRYRQHFADKPIVVSQFSGRDALLQSYGKLTDMLLDLAQAEIAKFMIIPARDNMMRSRIVALTMRMMYRIARKMVKVSFGMFHTKENTIKHYVATVLAYKDLIIKRAPILMYNRRVYKLPGIEVDAPYFNKLFK